MNRRKPALAAALMLTSLWSVSACSLFSGDGSPETDSAPAFSTEAAAPETDDASSDNGEEGTEPGTKETETATVTETASSSDDDGECGSLSAEQQLNEHAWEVPLSGYGPGLEYAETENYDPCAALSWIVLPIDHGTASSPYQIMLFHNGEYLGTATAKAYGYHPDVTRESDSEISVVYHWPREGEGTANSTGRTYAQFRWDDAEQRVIMSGDVPPER